MADNQVEILLSVKSGDSEAQIKKLRIEIKELGSQTDKSLKQGASAFKIFEGVVAGSLVADAIKGFASAALDLFKTFTVEGVSAASKTEAAINSLNNALAQNGQFSKQASEDFVAYANEIQKTTKFSDDATISTGALISTLGGLSGQALKDATTAAINLSAALGIDLNSAATLVGKAAQGSIETFSRYGIQIKKGADNAETFANALNTLSRFNGRAAAEANTFSGAQAILNNQFEDLQKSIGQIIISNPVLIELFKQIGSILSQGSEIFRENSKVISETFSSALITGVGTVSAFATSLAYLTDVSKAVGGAFLSASQIVAAFFAVLSTRASGGAGAGEILNQLSEDLKNNFKGVGEVNFADRLAEQLDQVQEKLIETKATADENKVFSPENQLIDLEILAQQRQAFLDKELDDLLKQRELLAQSQLESDQVRLAENTRVLQELETKTAESDSRKLKIQRQFAKEQAKVEKERAENFKSTLNVIATLQANAGGELFRIGQAAAIATATIDGIAAVQKALASAPPPFNFALAALVGVATGANIAKIASAKPPALAGGIDSVPGGFSNDTFPAFLSSGERVVPAESNKDLTSFLSAQGGQSALLASIDSKLSRLNQMVVVNIGQKEIFRELRDGLESGRSLTV